MTEYEVKCIDTWAWYPAYVHDYDATKKQLYIAYPDDWKEATWVSPEHVRPPPDPQINLDEWHPQIEEEVECQAKAEENEQHGWWSCKIKSYQSNKFCVSFDGWGNEHNVILQKELLRPKNRNKCLTSRNLMKAEVSVKPELVPWAKNNPTQLAELRLLHKKLIHMNFNHQSNQIILIAPKTVLQSVKSIVELHLLRQESLNKQKNKTLRAEMEMQKRKKIEESAYRASFPVHPLLSGYCCGVKRSNFEKVARDSQGQIIKISIENGSCVIKGRTQEAIDRAEMELKIISKKLILTKKEVAFLIGFNGGNIRKLKSHVQLLKLVSKKFAKDDFEQLKDKAIRSELKRIDQRERRSNRQNNQSNYSYDNLDTINDLKRRYNNKLPQNLLTCSLDTFFNKDDIVDLCEIGTPEKEKDDFIVLIGKENEVNLCISMIELSLTYLRKQKERDAQIRQLQNQIRDLKGIPPIKSPEEREREREQRELERNNRNNNRNNNNNNNNNTNDNTDDKETKDKEYSTDMPNDDNDMKDESNNNNNRRQGNNRNRNKNKNNNTSSVNDNPNGTQTGNQTSSSKKSKKNKRKRRKKNKRSNVPDTVPN